MAMDTRLDGVHRRGGRPPIDPRYCGYCGWLYWHDKWNQRHCLCTIESKRAFLPPDEKLDAFRAEWTQLPSGVALMRDAGH